MDFPDLRMHGFMGIQYQLSQLFDQDYGFDYAIQDNAAGYVIYDMDVYFCVEKFDANDADVISFAFDLPSISRLDAVHDNYILRRKASLEDPEVGIKKELPKSVKFPGFLQVQSGARFDYGPHTSYFTATLEIDGEYFVFQLIGKEENMGYLYDDFIAILSSVRR